MLLVITNALLCIGVIASPYKSLTIYKLDSIEGIDCQPWFLNVKENKDLCWGGDVSFQNYSKDIGIALHVKITLADSNNSRWSNIIGFDNCEKQLVKTQECACISDNGNKSFNYNCAKAFTSSDNDSIIKVQIQNDEGHVVKEVILKLPSFSKSETSSKPTPDSSSETAEKRNKPENTTPDSRQTSEKTIPDFHFGVLIGVLSCVFIALIAVIVALAFSIRLNWKQHKEIKKLKEQLQSGKETKCIKDIKPEDGKKELEEDQDVILVSETRKLNKLSRHSEAKKMPAHTRDNVTNISDSDLPLLNIRETPSSHDTLTRNESVVDIHNQN